MREILLAIGATGMLGQPVSRCLKKAGFKTRIMTRDRQKASQVLDDAFEITVGDPMDIGCLE